MSALFEVFREYVQSGGDIEVASQAVTELINLQPLKEKIFLVSKLSQLLIDEMEEREKNDA